VVFQSISRLGDRGDPGVVIGAFPQHCGLELGRIVDADHHGLRRGRACSRVANVGQAGPRSYRILAAFVAGLTEDDLARVIAYVDFRGET
jgi:hypothetical protein